MYAVEVLALNILFKQEYFLGISGISLAFLVLQVVQFYSNKIVDEKIVPRRMNSLLPPGKKEGETHANRSKDIEV